MDNGDFFVGLIRAVMDWCHIFIVGVTYTCLISSFSYFRLYVYFVDVLKMSFFCPKGFHNNSRLLHSLLTALLWVLLVLNIYWGILLVKMGL